MNTTVAYSSEHSWSRRCSTETIFSIQGRETDFVRDTSDTEWCSDEQGVEFEPVTEPEDEDAVIGDTSGQSENEIISTKVVAVSVLDDGSLQLADSECTESSSDSELDLHDYWLCATCRVANNTPLYRYCEKCFRIRKNFFPPRPKPKRKRKPSIEPTDPQPILSQDSGVESLIHSQGSEINSQQLTDSADRLSKRIKTDSSDSDTDIDSDSDRESEEEKVKPLSFPTESSKQVSRNITASRSRPKRKRKPSIESSNSQSQSQDLEAESLTSQRSTELADSTRLSKRIKIDYNTDIDSDLNKCKEVEVKPLLKTISDPALTVDSVNFTDNKEVIMNDKDKIDTKDNTCIICTTEPKSGVFVHGRIAHICCCYKCAIEVWKKAKRCPVCNCKVSNVLRAVVM